MTSLLVATAVVAGPGALAAEDPAFGPRLPVATVDAGAFLQEVALGDLTGDGFEDVVVTTTEWQSEELFPITILVNDGAGGFVDRTTELFDGPVTETQFARQTVLVDLNGDDRLDILVADTGIDAHPFPGYRSALALSTPDGRWVDASGNLPSEKRFTHSAAAADVDGDGDADVLLGHLGTPLELLLNDGDGQFVTAPAGALPDAVTRSRWTRVALADLVGGPAPDVVLLGDENTPEPTLLRNDDVGRFTEVDGALPAKPFGDDAIGLAIRPVEITGDDDLDLVLGWTKGDPYYVGRWIQVLVNEGDGTFSDETAQRLPQTDNDEQWPYDVVAADLEPDGDQDLAMSTFPGGASAFYLNDGDGSFRAMAPTAFAEEPKTHALLTDVDGDGRADVFSGWQAGIGNAPHEYFVSMQRVPASARGSHRWCANPAIDGRAAAGRLPKQGVIAVQRTGTTTYRPRSIAADGTLDDIPLAGHDPGTRLVAAWQTPATCRGLRVGGWATTPEGRALTDGDRARHVGDLAGVRLNRPVVGMSPTPSGDGYWLVASDGGMFTFGDAQFLGSTGAIPLNQPIVAMASTPSGRGYWLVASDGGMFTFGDAPFLGSMGATPLNQPIVGMVPTPTGRGYWMVASDGGIFTFGNAAFKGSTGATGTRTPIVGLVPSGTGYTIVEEDGTLHSFR